MMRERKTIKQLRQERNKMSQQTLAVAVGVSVSTITKLEAGAHTPRLKLAQDIARVFDIGVDDIEWTPAPKARAA